MIQHPNLFDVWDAISALETHDALHLRFIGVQSNYLCYAQQILLS